MVRADMRLHAERIKELRTERDWSQERLARAAGLSYRTVARMENGRGSSTSTILAVAQALGVPLDDLFEEAS